MDYVVTVFAYAKPRVETSKQKEERQRRVDRRRQVLAEAAELGKENQEDAAGGLLQEIELRLKLDSQKFRCRNTGFIHARPPYH